MGKVQKVSRKCHRRQQVEKKLNLRMVDSNRDKICQNRIFLPLEERFCFSLTELYGPIIRESFRNCWKRCGGHPETRKGKGEIIRLNFQHSTLLSPLSLPIQSRATTKLEAVYWAPTWIYWIVLFQCHLHFSTKLRSLSSHLSPTIIKMLHHSEVAKHNTPEDLWLIVSGNAYDLTEVRYLSRN